MSGGAGVRAVRGGERVVDVDVGEPGQLLGHDGIVLLLAGVEPGVFEHQDLAGLQLGDGFLGDRADAVVGEEDVAGEQVAQGGADRAQRQAGDALAVRAGRNG